MHIEVIFSFWSYPLVQMRRLINSYPTGSLMALLIYLIQIYLKNRTMGVKNDKNIIKGRLHTAFSKVNFARRLACRNCPRHYYR